MCKYVGVALLGYFGCSRLTVEYLQEAQAEWKTTVATLDRYAMSPLNERETLRDSATETSFGGTGAHSISRVS